MRLSSLEPTLDDVGGGAAYLEFWCPVHGVGAMRHAGNPPNFEGFPDKVNIKIGPVQATHVWGWNGERDFEKMVLWPSINFTGHWHGFIGGNQRDQPGEVNIL